MLQFKLEINAETAGDLEMALEQARNQVSNGFTSGFDRNETSNYHFSVTGEEVVVEDEEDEEEEEEEDNKTYVPSEKQVEFDNNFKNETE